VKLEEALQSVPGCEGVMLPFWDECSADSLANGIPWALTQESFDLDGQTIPNPSRSFAFTRQITDNIGGDTPNYSKPKGYETVRYPLSGLVGTDAEVAPHTTVVAHPPIWSMSSWLQVNHGQRG
jgi:tyrosinase